MFKTILAAGICAVFLSGCAETSQMSDTPAEYCHKQGSELAISQCSQYYAKNTSIQPPAPRVYDNGAGYNPALGLYLMHMQDLQMRQQEMNAANNRAQLQQYNQQQRSINCSSNFTGNFVSTTCN
jgi:hypothetical protein